MSDRTVKVKALKNHYDKTDGVRYMPGDVYWTEPGSAERRSGRGLVEILYEAGTAGPGEGEAHQPVEEVKEETGVGTYPDEENLLEEYPGDTPPKIEESSSEFDPWDYIEDHGGPYYNVEGHDDNPVQGKSAAEKIARKLHS